MKKSITTNMTAGDTVTEDPRDEVCRILIGILRRIADEESADQANTTADA